MSQRGKQETFKVVREEIIKEPTSTSEGELLKHYSCGYCGHKAKKMVNLKMSSKLEGAQPATA